MLVTIVYYNIVNMAIIVGWTDNCLTLVLNIVLILFHDCKIYYFDQH